MTVLSGGTSTCSAPTGLNAPVAPRTLVVTTARVVAGLTIWSWRAPAPSGTPGMTTVRRGPIEAGCQSAPAGVRPTLRRSRAIADTRPDVARTQTVSGPDWATSDSSETVRESWAGTIRPGLPGTTTRPDCPKNLRSTSA